MSGTSCLLPLTQLSQKATAHADLASTPCGMAHKQVSGCSEKSRALPHARREPRNHPSGPCSRFSCQRTVLQNAGGVQIPPAVTVYIDSLLRLIGIPGRPGPLADREGLALHPLTAEDGLDPEVGQLVAMDSEDASHAGTDA